MDQKGEITIRLIRGLVEFEARRILPGDVFHVGKEILEHLEERKSPTLQFEILEGKGTKPTTKNPPAPPTTVPTGSSPAGSGDGKGGEGANLPAGHGSETGDDDQDGEGDEEDQEGNGDGAGDGAGADSNNSQGPNGGKSPVFGFVSIDAETEARIIAAGFDTLDKLKAAAKNKLTTIKGMGKIRAEALIQEVGAL